MQHKDAATAPPTNKIRMASEKKNSSSSSKNRFVARASKAIERAEQHRQHADPSWSINSPSYNYRPNNEKQKRQQRSSASSTTSLSTSYLQSLSSTSSSSVSSTKMTASSSLSPSSASSTSSKDDEVLRQSLSLGDSLKAEIISSSVKRSTPTSSAEKAGKDRRNSAAATVSSERKSTKLEQRDTSAKKTTEATPSLSRSAQDYRNNRVMASTKKKTVVAPPAHRRRSSSSSIQYDIESILNHYDRRPLEVGWRLNVLGLPLLMWYIQLLSDKAFHRKKSTQLQKLRGRELRQHLVRSGSVALIKSGQALSLRPDLLRNKYWAEELGQLVDAVGSFSDRKAMRILEEELSDLLPILEKTRDSVTTTETIKDRSKTSSPILDLFDFHNDGKAVASASIGQVYRATLRKGPLLEAALGTELAKEWGGKVIALKIQRPDAYSRASIDMYLLRRAAEWLNVYMGAGDASYFPAIADQFGRQLFGELDYIQEANNGEHFRALYGHWERVVVPKSCLGLTRQKVLVTEWIDGLKGPWYGKQGKDMVNLGLKCSVDQLLNTGLFHADPHRGNLLMTTSASDSRATSPPQTATTQPLPVAQPPKLAFIDFGMMAQVSAENRYGLIGLIIGLQLKDLPLVTDNLLKLGFLDDTTQLDLLVPRLRQALLRSTGNSGKASQINFATLQAELDSISRDKLLKMKTPAFFSIIIRSLTILEGFALSVDPNFKLVRGAYPYVLAQLLTPDDASSTSGRSSSSTAPPDKELQALLTRLLTIDGEGKYIQWERLRDFLRLAKKAAKSDSYKPDDDDDDVKSSSSSGSSKQTIEIFVKFLTSKSGLFLKEPLVHELAEAIDGMASVNEARLLKASRGLIQPLPGGNGPINQKRMDEIRTVLEVVQSAIEDEQQQIVQNIPSGVIDGAGGITSFLPSSPVGGGITTAQRAIQQNILRLEAMRDLLMDLFGEMMVTSSSSSSRNNSIPLVNNNMNSGTTVPRTDNRIWNEIVDVAQKVAIEVLEIRGTRAIRHLLRIDDDDVLLDNIDINDETKQKEQQLSRSRE